jgi:hypothetical protein
MDKNLIERLGHELEAAKAELTRAVAALAPRHVGGEMQAYESAQERLLAAERRLAEAEGRSYAIPEECPLEWDVGAPLPTLLQSDSRTLLLFYLASEVETVGVVDFGHCFATTLGGPNDETFAGHPLYGSGFMPYKAMQVINSPWIAALERTNSVHPRHDPARYSAARHLIFPFHDTTFECVARSFQTSSEPGSLATVARKTLERLF